MDRRSRQGVSIFYIFVGPEMCVFIVFLSGVMDSGVSGRKGLALHCSGA